MRRLRPRLIVLWVFGLLLTPGVAWLAGVRNDNIEQRTYAALPDFRKQKPWRLETVRAFDAFLTDRVPLRDRAAAARGWVGYRIFQTSTSPQVRIGDDGWLFLEEELLTCTNAVSVADTAAAYAMVLDVIAKTGRRGVLAIAPDKITIYPEHLPRLTSDEACALKRDAEYRVAFPRIPSSLDLWSSLEAAKPSAAVYYRADSHWTQTGALQFFRGAVQTVAPGLWSDGVVQVGPPQRYPGDLGRFLGLHLEDPQPFRPIVRPGVSSVEEVVDGPPDGYLRHFVGTTTAAPLVTGTTVFVGDSQGDHEDRLAMLQPWFADLWFCHWNALVLSRCNGMLESASTVIVESVERAASVRVQFASVASLVNTLIRGKEGRPLATGAALAGDGVATLALPARLTADTARYVRVETDAPVEGTLVDGAGAALAPGGPPFTETTTGTFIVLVIPAGSTATAVRIVGPPGTAIVGATLIG